MEVNNGYIRIHTAQDLASKGAFTLIRLDCIVMVHTHPSNGAAAIRCVVGQEEAVFNIEMREAEQIIKLLEGK